MEDQITSLIYNINLCRICQDPNSMDVINTSSRLQECKANETFMDALKLIFTDIRWIEDEFLSVACKLCFKKVTEISEFKRMCLKINLERGSIDTIFLSKAEVDPLIVDDLPEKNYDDNVSSPEVDAQPQLPTVKTELKQSLDIEIDGSSEQHQSIIKSTRKATKRKRHRSKKANADIDKEDKLDSKNKCCRCDVCGEDFKNSRLLERHIFRHNGTRNYICPVCGRKYITNGDLITHYKSHSVELKFECDICQKRFKAIRNLSTHKAIVHMDPKDYKHLCTICGNKFPTSERLKEHTKRHNQIKNYSCDLCEKAFVSKAEMLRHATSHSNFQPFKCDLCSVEYKKKDFLLVHKSRQHGIGNYKRRLRQCEKPYQCRLCDAKFICKSNIKPHLKKKHDINVDLRNDFDASEYYNIVLEIALEDNNKESE